MNELKMPYSAAHAIVDKYYNRDGHHVEGDFEEINYGSHRNKKTDRN